MARATCRELEIFLLATVDIEEVPTPLDRQSPGATQSGREACGLARRPFLGSGSTGLSKGHHQSVSFNMVSAALSGGWPVPAGVAQACQDPA